MQGAACGLRRAGQRGLRLCGMQQRLYRCEVRGRVGQKDGRCIFTMGTSGKVGCFEWEIREGIARGLECQKEWRSGVSQS